MDDKKICFVMMPFTAPEGYSSSHFDDVYTDIFAPAIEAAGMKPMRVDNDMSSTSILSRIINGVVTAPMALCDLSTKNPNVLYELGIRHAFKLPVVLVQEEGEKRIFDVNDINTISYDKSLKYKRVPKDQERITKALLATEVSEFSPSVFDILEMEEARRDFINRKGNDGLEIFLQSMMKDLDIIKKEVANDKGTGDVKISYEILELMEDIEEFNAYLQTGEAGEPLSRQFISFKENDLTQRFYQLAQRIGDGEMLGKLNDRLDACLEYSRRIKDMAGGDEKADLRAYT